MSDSVKLRCPVCGEQFDPTKSKAMPFCCGRCRDIDLGRWMDERYGLPAEPPWEEDDLGEMMN